MKTFDAKVQGKIKETLMNYKNLIKLSLKDSVFFMIAWKKMPLKERVDFARTLVYMEQVAKNPKKYFSKAETDAAWFNRVQKYADENAVSVEDAFEEVQCPCDIVYEKCGNVLKQTPFYSDYFDFLVCVQNYEYSDDVQRKSFVAQDIMYESEKIKDLLTKKKEDRWYRALRMMKGFDENKR